MRRKKKEQQKNVRLKEEQQKFLKSEEEKVKTARLFFRERSGGKAQTKAKVSFSHAF